MTEQAPTISVVVPMLNEAGVVDTAIDAIRGQIETTGHGYELVCVDDGSTDATADELARASRRDPRVQVVQLARNFGKESALFAGMSAARGQAVLFMDADLQHPPETIPRMIEQWEKGFDVVSGVKQTRARESLTYRFMAACFNFLMGGVVGTGFRGASDFKLIDRQVVEALLDCPERNRFFRGLVTWVGFRTTEVPFEVADRVGGSASWSTWGLVKYSIRNLLAFSSLPLRLVATLGFLGLVGSLAIGATALYHFITGYALSGFTTVILLQVLMGGVLLAGLGVIALYVAVLYEEVKRRPVFVVRRPRAGAPVARPSAPSPPPAAAAGESDS